MALKTIVYNRAYTGTDEPNGESISSSTASKANHLPCDSDVVDPGTKLHTRKMGTASHSMPEHAREQAEECK